MRLADGITALDLSLPAGAEEKLAAYLALLAKWNKVYNLTAIRDPDEMVTHHLLDSLAVLPELQKSALAGRRQPDPPPTRGRQFTLADIGSGAGLPGLVLAIARPDWKVTSVEAVEKKAAFQRQAAIELGLGNVSIHCGRVEDCTERFDAAIARAYASLADFVASAGHLADTLWAMKGGYPADEIAALPPDTHGRCQPADDGTCTPCVFHTSWRVVASHRLAVPGLAAERHLLQLGRT